jgi:hypothetical protein
MEFSPEEAFQTSFSRGTSIEADPALGELWRAEAPNSFAAFLPVLKPVCL